MPKAGLTMIEGTITSWRVAEGEQVANGQVVMEYENEKNIIECLSPYDGLLHIVAREGDVIAVGGTIGYIAENQVEYAALQGGAAPEAAPGAASPAVAPAALPAAASAASAVPAAVSVPAAASIPASAPQPQQNQGRINATGYAKKLAQQHQVDLRTVKPSGANGRIVAKDVLARAGSGGAGAKTAAAAAGSEAAAAVAAATGTSAAPGRPAVSGEPVITPLAGLKRAVANNMFESLHSMAQCNNTAEFDVTDLIGFRSKLLENEAFLGRKITLNDLLTMAAIRTLQKNPLLNSTFDGTNITTYPNINLGTAVATDIGLMVPVIANAEQLTLLELSQVLREAAARARENKLQPGEQSRGTFTLTNVGMFPIDTGTPIISPPQVAIIGFGRTVKKPAVYQDQICIRAMMTVFITYDHRVLDGATIGSALQTLQKYLENPALICA